MNVPDERPTITADAYTEEYFLTECDGFAAYLDGAESGLTTRLETLWRFLDAAPGMRILDLGCGRGEILIACGQHGIEAVGIDYAPNALTLAQQAIARARAHTLDRWISPHILLGNAQQLPFEDKTFDRVIMSDIVEHLYPRELKRALAEVRRVLAPGGELLIHTMPNLWYYHYGYPVFRFVQRLRGIRLPTDPRERFKFSHVHVNEQTPRALRRMLAQIGFAKWRVWLHDYRDYAEQSPGLRQAMHLLTHTPLIKKVFCDDIFARAHK